MHQAASATLHLRALASAPRPAGSAAESAARSYCAAQLHDAGFQVHEERFTYSDFPGRYGTPLAGILFMLAIAIASRVALSGRAAWALGVLLTGAGALGVFALWLTQRGVMVFPLLRREGHNLVAQRGTPRLWLVAHLDSKSQPISIALRATGITACAGVWICAMLLAEGQLAGASTARWWPWLAGAALIAGLPVALSFVGDRSPGALDNASGVAAVLLAAAATQRPLGVLLTSAEELGLAGARAWAREHPVGRAINVDGIDDAGMLTVMHTGRRAGDVLTLVLRAAASVRAPMTSRPLLPGILVDGVALADRGWSVVTISRGTVATLARIHTPRDNVGRLRGDGVTEAARVIAAAIEEDA